MNLQDYYEGYADKSDKDIAKRSQVKQEELETIFSAVQLSAGSNPVRIAVLGCGDVRFTQAHARMFVEVLDREVEMSTFDIDTEHLAGGEGSVIQHDCSLPLPDPPYDITYAHVLLKFMEKDKQLATLRNSIDALKPGGLAIHVLDENDADPEYEREEGLHAVVLDEMLEDLENKGLAHKRVPLKYGYAIVVQKNTA